jgi:error-prone DNA polymerase
MGFYAPAQLVRDARDHGVEVRPISVNHSFWDCTLEPRPDGALALRLGFRQIKGMREEDAIWIAAARGNGYPDVESLWRRAGVHARCAGTARRGRCLRRHRLTAAMRCGQPRR